MKLFDGCFFFSDSNGITKLSPRKYIFPSDAVIQLISNLRPFLETKPFLPCTQNFVTRCHVMGCGGHPTTDTITYTEYPATLRTTPWHIYIHSFIHLL